MTKKLVHVRIRDVDEEVWDRFHAHIRNKYGTVYGHLAEEFEKALSTYIEASPPSRTQQPEATSSTSDTLLRLDVVRNLNAIRAYLAKQFVPDPATEWCKIPGKALSTFLGSAIRRDPRTIRRYASRLRDMGYVRLDQEDPDFVYVSARWLFASSMKEPEQANRKISP